MCCICEIMGSFFSFFNGKDEKTEPMTKAKVNCELFKKENTSRHHTDEYDNDNIVLRRGNTFIVKLTYQDVTFEEILNTTLLVKFEPTMGTNVAQCNKCVIMENIDKDVWSMVIEEKNENMFQIVLKINVPVTALVGKYHIEVLLPSEDTPIKAFKTIIIFNPWNEEDEVYLQDEQQRNEYILNDTGIIYRGSNDNIGGKQWNFGQFERDVLDCVLQLLDTMQQDSLKSVKKRASVIWVSRNLSSLLNSIDNKGLLEGNWSGDYSGGKRPTSWNGSVEIYQSYFKSKKPVKYGQCWVFSGVTTTALRALGIPARSITNFNSAHDTDRSMTIDKIVDSEGENLELSKDSIWNFHVWNELWAKRSDQAGTKYDGWQVVDATPQEASFGRFQMGPAPVSAVKNGEVYVGFDCDFLFAEVNADYVIWLGKQDEHGTLTFEDVRYKNVHYVGKHISTKEVGSDERQDVTNSYKYDEHSEDEKKARLLAINYGVGSAEQKALLHSKEEMEIKIDLDTTNGKLIPNGENFTCTISVENVTKEDLNLEVSGVIVSADYTGKSKSLIKKEKFGDVHVSAGQKTTLEIDINAKDYDCKLTIDNCLNFSAIAKVLGNKHLYVDDCILLLYNKDNIEIKVDKPPLKVGENANVSIKFKNTLPQMLQKLEYTIEGPGLLPPTTKKRDNLGQGEEQTVKFGPFKPTKAGKKTLYVDIDTQFVQDIKSSIIVDVEESD